MNFTKYASKKANMGNSVNYFVDFGAIGVDGAIFVNYFVDFPCMVDESDGYFSFLKLLVDFNSRINTLETMRTLGRICYRFLDR